MTLRRFAGALCGLAAVGSATSNDLDSFIKSKMKYGRIPGLSAAVIKDGKVHWEGHYGSALPNITDGPAVNGKTVFEVASVSKTMTGLGVLVLKEHGLLDPHDDVNKYLPFSIRNPHYPDEPITLHGLLTHTSSICDDAYDDLPGVDLYFEGDAPMSLETFFKKMLSKDGDWYSKDSFRRKKPQVHYEYSNIGAALSGYIAERVAQRAGIASSIDELVRSRVLGPLNITNAGFLVTDFGGLSNLAPPAGAVPSDTDSSGDRYVSYCFFGNPDYPDGTFKISAPDYAKVLAMISNGGVYQGVRVLKSETVDYLKSRAGAPCSPLPCGGELPQGNAFFYYKTQRGRTMLGHNGGEYGIATEVFFNVDTGVGYVVFTNGDWGSDDSDYSVAFEDIERRLLETFDSEAQLDGAVDATSAPRSPKRRPARRGRCPCHLPCDDDETVVV